MDSCQQVDFIVVDSDLAFSLENAQMSVFDFFSLNHMVSSENNLEILTLCGCVCGRCVGWILI